jgi:hypothetical protein
VLCGLRMVGERRLLIMVHDDLVGVCGWWSRVAVAVRRRLTKPSLKLNQPGCGGDGDHPAIVIR